MHLDQVQDPLLFLDSIHISQLISRVAAPSSEVNALD